MTPEKTNVRKNFPDVIWGLVRAQTRINPLFLIEKIVKLSYDWFNNNNVNN